MGKTYERADEEVLSLVADMIEKHHPHLKKAGVTIDVMMADNDTGDAVTLRGNKCLAVVRIISLKDRAKGMADAEITISREDWDFMELPERQGLVDHELYHLMTTGDEFEGYKQDSQGRPKLTMRPHTIETGWFDVIAKRNGDASPEVIQARKILAKYKNIFFPFLNDNLPGLQ